MALGIDVRDQVGPALQGLSKAAAKDVAKVMGTAVRNYLKAWFFKLDKERANQMGGKRTHFYAQVAGSVQAPKPVSGGAMVSINHIGIAQRRFGGTIEPGPGKQWLAIPARSEAHGKRPGEFSNLHFVYFRNDLAALVENTATQLRKVKGVLKAVGETGGGIYFWLKRRVFQQADPSVLPPDAELMQPALAKAADYLERAWERRLGA